jgi:hypothetical protein
MLAHLAISSLALFQGKAKAPIKAPPAPPAFAYGLVGVTNFPGPFDPLNLSKDAPESSVRLWREAELMHGRVGMLASAGFLVQESYHPLFGGTITGPAINQIPEIPPFFWAVLSFGIGISEAYRIQIGCARPLRRPRARRAARTHTCWPARRAAPTFARPTDLTRAPLRIRLRARRRGNASRGRPAHE